MSKVEIDDVTYALSGKIKLAERTLTLNVPASVSTTGQRRMKRVSTSEHGDKLLEKANASKEDGIAAAKEAYDQGVEKLRVEREAAEKKAWGELNKVFDQIDALKETGKKAKRTSTGESQETSDTPDDTAPESTSDDSQTSDSQDTDNASSLDSSNGYGGYQQDRQW